jgi:hypothetical protein
MRTPVYSPASLTPRGGRPRTQNTNVYTISGSDAVYGFPRVRQPCADRPAPGGPRSLWDTVLNAQNTKNKGLGRPKTKLRVTSADGWGDCEDLACPFCNTHEQNCGLKIVGRDATAAAVESVACRFRTVYEREGQGDRKRHTTAVVKYFATPFRPPRQEPHASCAPGALSGILPPCRRRQGVLFRVGSVCEHPQRGLREGGTVLLHG